MLYGMIVIGGISIFTTITRPKRFTLPLLDLHADATWLTWACPAILTGLWLYFGYELYAYIIGRIYLINLGQIIENSIHLPIRDPQPLKYSIEDQSIGDFLFYLLSPRYDVTRGRFEATLSWSVLIVFYGGLLGAIHGTIIAGGISWLRIATNKILAVLNLVLLWLLLLLSHLAFNVRTSSLWRFDLAICVIGAATFTVLNKTAKSSRDAARST